MTAMTVIRRPFFRPMIRVGARGILMLLLMLLSLAPNASAEKIKLATLSPDGSFWMTKMREGAAEVTQKTAGRVEVKFYPGGVMGDDKAVLRKIRIGQLHGGAFVAGSLADVYPDIQIYGLPLTFNSLEEIDHVRERMDPLLHKGIEAGGFVSFGLAEGGFAYIMSAGPIRTPGDLNQRKVWVPDSDPTVLEGVKAFDISPIPLSIADVRAGLQTGLIDTVATPPIGAVALQWHTQVRYVLDLPFLYSYAVLALDAKIFNRLSPGDQSVFQEVMSRIFKDIDRQNRDDNVKAIKALREQGIEFVKPTDVEVEEWRSRSAPIPDRLVRSGRFSRSMMDELRRNLQDFRTP